MNRDAGGRPEEEPRPCGLDPSGDPPAVIAAQGHVGERRAGLEDWRQSRRQRRRFRQAPAREPEGLEPPTVSPAIFSILVFFCPGSVRARNLTLLWDQ